MSSNTIKVPKFVEIAEALGLDAPQPDEIGGAIWPKWTTPDGVEIILKPLGHGWHYRDGMAIVMEQSTYPMARYERKCRRSLKVYKSAFKSDASLVARPCTEAEAKALVAKYAEVKEAQLEATAANRARNRAEAKERKKKEDIEKTLEAAGIDRWKDEHGLSLYLDRPEIRVDLRGKSKLDIIRLYKAIEQLLKEIEQA
jgi:hypothetical protein